VVGRADHSPVGGRAELIEDGAGPERRGSISPAGAEVWVARPDHLVGPVAPTTSKTTVSAPRCGS